DLLPSGRLAPRATRVQASAPSIPERALGGAGVLAHRLLREEPRPHRPCAPALHADRATLPERFVDREHGAPRSRDLREPARGCAGAVVAGYVALRHVCDAAGGVRAAPHRPLRLASWLLVPQCSTRAPTRHLRRPTTSSSIRPRAPTYCGAAFESPPPPPC